MRTFNEWDKNRVGFLEVDLVAHTTDMFIGIIIFKKLNEAMKEISFRILNEALRLKILLNILLFFNLKLNFL
ncbi:MAG: hypothetical protein N3A56_05395 [Thermodesulfobacteriaceae bacterium]|nr:hypothetical protein [Thermodesulfobacteriaceae bacterium]